MTSVVAGPDVPADVVLAAAHDAARDRIDRVPLAEVPLGDGPAWTVTESTGTGDRVSAVLPAWSATSEHDLRGEAFGFAGAAAVLGRLFGAGRGLGRRAGRHRPLPPRRLRGGGGHGRRGADELPAAGQAPGGRAAVRPALRGGGDGHGHGPVGGAAGLLRVGGRARRGMITTRRTFAGLDHRKRRPHPSSVSSRAAAPRGRPPPGPARPAPGAIESRSRTVTAWSESESKSTVRQNGVPISSWRR